MTTRKKKLIVTVNIHNTLNCMGNDIEFIKRSNTRQIQREIPDINETLAMKNALDKVITNVNLIRLAQSLNNVNIYEYRNNPYYNFYKESIDEFINHFSSVIEKDMQFASQQ